MSIKYKKPDEGSATLVWDFSVRLFHWALALSVAGAYITHELGIDYFVYHQWFGYTVIVLVLFRLVWGFIGSYHARFANFVRSPVNAWHYLRDQLAGRHRFYAGHNPLGAYMVMFLLLAVLIQAATGLFATDDIINAGPLNALVSEQWSSTLTSIHHQLFNILLVAIGVHVLAVIMHSVVHGDNLIAAMLHGRKKTVFEAAEQPLRSSRTNHKESTE